MAAGKIQHWKHGWIPISPEAKAIVAARKNRGHIGGASWGSSRGRSTRMTGASAELMGIPGWRYPTSWPDDGSTPTYRRYAANMLRKIRDATPRTRPLFHEEAMPHSRLLDFQPGRIVHLPLTATAPDLAGASGYGRIKPEDDDGSKVRVMMEFAPGTRGYRYQAGEWITAGAFRVKEVRADKPDMAFDYKRQQLVDQPITRIVLEPVRVFDPDAANELVRRP